MAVAGNCLPPAEQHGAIVEQLEACDGKDGDVVPQFNETVARQKPDFWAADIRCPAAAGANIAQDPTKFDADGRMHLRWGRSFLGNRSISRGCRVRGRFDWRCSEKAARSDSQLTQRR